MDFLDPSAAFSSQARFRVLKALQGHSVPLPLRQIEKLTGLAIRSVQVATEGLLAENLVTRKKIHRNVCYQMNPHHPLSTLLNQVFDLIRDRQLEMRALQYQKKARALLQYSDDLLHLTRKGRRL